jgi:hypothetical protein
MLDGSFSRDEKEGNSKKNSKQERDKNERDLAPRPSKRPKSTQMPENATVEESSAPSRKDSEVRASHLKKHRKRSEAVGDEKRKIGRNLGSLIGRKRRERRINKSR